MFLAILIPSESATSVFFSHNLCNNFRANYLLLFGKFSDSMRKLIPSECECLWLPAIFFSQHVSLCVLANVNYRRCSYHAARTFLICLPPSKEIKKITTIKSRARSCELLRLATVISVSGKINVPHLHFCTQLHNGLITYVPLWKLNIVLLQINK